MKEKLKLLLLPLLFLNGCVTMQPMQSDTARYGYNYDRPERETIRELSRNVEELERLVRSLDMLRYEIENLNEGLRK